MNVDTKADIHTVETKPLSPLYAIVMYGHIGDSTFVHGATKHKIRQGKLSSGQIIDINGLKNHFVNLNVYKEHQCEILPDNILADNSNVLCWYKPASFRNMWIKCGSSLSLRVMWPALLFIYDKKSHSLRVGALATNARPKATTKVYRPPLMNINDNLALCQGGAQLPKVVNFDNLEEAENTLYDSWFTHSNTKQLLKGISDDGKLTKFWKKRNGLKERIRASDLLFYRRLKELLQ